MINFEYFSISRDNILTISTVLTVYVFMTLSMVLFFFIYLGIHTYHRTKSDRISLEIGTQRPEMSEGSRNPMLPATRIMVKFLEDIDIRKAPAPFHYAFYLIRYIIWSAILVYVRYDEITALIVLTTINTTFLLYMMYVRPFKTNLNNRIGIFVEMCTLCVTLCIFPYIRAWPPRPIFIDFARLQFAILWIMVLTIPLLLVADHFWKSKIMKQDYFQKPHRTIFASRKKPKKLAKIQPPTADNPLPAEGEGEGEGDIDKKKEDEKIEEKPKQKPTPKEEPKSQSEKTEMEEEESEEGDESETSRTQSEGVAPPPGSRPRRKESDLEESKDDAEIIFEKPDDGDDNIEMNIISADVEVAPTAADFRENYSKDVRKY